MTFAGRYGFGYVFSYRLVHKAGPVDEKPILDGLDPCRRNRTECGSMQILHVFGFCGGVVRSVALRNVLVSVGVRIGEG